MTETEALNSIPYPHYYNATYKFSSGTTEWLVALQVNFFSNANPFVAMFLYKIGGDSGKNLAILGLDLQSNVSGWLNVILWNSQLEQNTNTVTAELHAGKTCNLQRRHGITSTGLHQFSILANTPREDPSPDNDDLSLARSVVVGSSPFSSSSI